MEQAPASSRREATDHHDRLVREWRVARFTPLGIAWPLARAAAGHIDWHQVATLADRRLRQPRWPAT